MPAGSACQAADLLRVDQIGPVHAQETARQRGLHFGKRSRMQQRASIVEQQLGVAAVTAACDEVSGADLLHLAGGRDAQLGVRLSSCAWSRASCKRSARAAASRRCACSRASEIPCCANRNSRKADTSR